MIREVVATDLTVSVYWVVGEIFGRRNLCLSSLFHSENRQYHTIYYDLVCYNTIQV